MELWSCGSGLQRVEDFEPVDVVSRRHGSQQLNGELGDILMKSAKISPNQILNLLIKPLHLVAFYCKILDIKNYEVIE